MPSDRKRRRPTVHPPGRIISVDFQPPSLTPARIVIAEADADTRELYREALAATPAQLVVVANGPDALVQCLLERPALVITDTWLPSLDGYALCELLRRDPLTSGVPIVVTTAKAGPIERQRLKQIGGVTVMEKPIAVEQLVEAAALSIDRLGDDSALPSDSIGEVRTTSRRFRPFVTQNPATPPPALSCSRCDRTLAFRRSRIGGVSRHEPERWDHFECPACKGAFEYRHRVRRLKAIS